MRFERRLSLWRMPLWVCSILLVSCGGDDGLDGINGSSGSNGTDGQSSLVLQSLLNVGNQDCPAGGVLIESGSDVDNDGLLGTIEVLQSNTVCDGIANTVLDPALVAEGKEIFRNDSFGSSQLWTGTLGLHEVIESGVSPNTALSVGLKVDADALPDGILESVDLDDPATTVALISLGAVIGIDGTVENIDGVDRLTEFGVTCALCHSTVDDSVVPGIGKRLDGWPNLDLNPGVILSLSPALQDSATQRVLTSWGAGKYDAYWNQDGLNDPTVIPPAYGFNGVHVATFTGEGDISYWNAYVAVTQMGAQGNFSDDDLGINITVPNGEIDLVTSKLPALREYQLSLQAPKPLEGSFDPVAAGRGKALFEDEAQCSSCHLGSNFTDANFRLHEPVEVGTDPLLAMRSKTGLYRTTPLAGAWQRAPYFHNGSAATLEDVVVHYNDHFLLGLIEEEQMDLVEYLKSL